MIAATATVHPEYHLPHVLKLGVLYQSRDFVNLGTTSPMKKVPDSIRCPARDYSSGFASSDSWAEDSSFF